MINLCSISKTYKIDNQVLEVLKDIDLTIEKGEFVAIMGPSGSGKSTLMNIIGCLDMPTSGLFEIDGKNVTSFSEVQLSKLRNSSIGFVFQNFQLLPRLTAIKNVELPMVYAGVKKKERRERALEALEKVGLADRISHHPNELSGGQKQRIAIARSLVNSPSIILADEPTGALDTKISATIMELLVKLNKEGTTILVVTHDREIAGYTDKIVNIRDGKIIGLSRKGKETSSL